MPKVVIDPLPIYGWQAHRISCGPLRLVVAPQIGGRIISVRYDGKELLYLNRELAGQVYDFSTIEDLAQEKRAQGFRIWGGDKTWVSPQKSWSEGVPPLELDAAAYQVELTPEQKIIMTSPVCRETGLQVQRTIWVDEEMTVHLKETLTNRRAEPIERGIWNVMQVPRPCMFFIPTAKGAFRSYHAEDPTLPEVANIFKFNEGWLEIPCDKPQIFKCGGMPTQGQVIIKLPMHHRKELVCLKTFKLENFVTYAHKSAIEVFNSDKANYAEIEIHSPMVMLAQDQSISLEQQWQFRKI